MPDLGLQPEPEPQPIPIPAATAPTAPAENPYGDVDEQPVTLGPSPYETLLNEAQRFGLSPSSNWRSRPHNAEVGGANNSYHLKGQAFDFIGDSKKLDNFHKYLQTAYGDQLAEVLHEKQGTPHEHVHVAWPDEAIGNPYGDVQEGPPIPEEQIQAQAQPQRPVQPKDLTPALSPEALKKSQEEEPAAVTLQTQKPQPYGQPNTDMSVQEAAKMKHLQASGTLDTSDLAQFATTKPEDTIKEIDRRIMFDMAKQAGLTPEETSEALQKYKFTPSSPVSVEQRLQAIQSGQYTYLADPAVLQYFQDVKQLLTYEKMTPEQKQAQIYQIAQTRPLTSEEERVLGKLDKKKDHYIPGLGMTSSITEPMISGFSGLAHTGGELMAGAGRALGVKPLQQAGEYVTKQSNVAQNIYGQPGIPGQIIKGAGEIAPDLIVSAALPEIKALK